MLSKNESYHRVHKMARSISRLKSKQHKKFRAHLICVELCRLLSSGVAKNGKI